MIDASADELRSRPNWRISYWAHAQSGTFPSVPTFVPMPEVSNTKLLSRKISDFCRVRISSALPPNEAERIRQYMLDLIAQRRQPPRKGRAYDWDEIASQCAFERDVLVTVRRAIEPGLDAIARALKDTPKPALPSPRPRPVDATRNLRGARSLGKLSVAQPSEATKRAPALQKVDRQKPGSKPRAVEEFPTPRFNEWIDPPTFQEALKLHMRRHGDSYWHLHRAVVRDDETFDHSTIRHWLQGSKAPRSLASALWQALSDGGFANVRVFMSSRHLPSDWPAQFRSKAGSCERYAEGIWNRPTTPRRRPSSIDAWWIASTTPASAAVAAK